MFLRGHGVNEHVAEGESAEVADTAADLVTRPRWCDIKACVNPERRDTNHVASCLGRC